MEIRIPQAFTADGSAVNFNHEEFHISINEHLLASRLPAPTSDIPSLQDDPSVFTELGVPPNAPICLDDYLTSDFPQLTLNVVSFTDMTLVSLCWLHIAADAMSLRDVATAWSLVLTERESEIPPLLSSGNDPLAPVGKDPLFLATHILEEQQVKGWWLFLWGLHFVFDLLWWRKMDTRTVFLPWNVVNQLRSNILASLAEKAEKDIATEVTQEQVSFVSEGDVVTAWVSLTAASALLPTMSSRTVGICNAFDLRPRLPSISPAKENQGTYMQNAVFPCSTNIPVRELIGKPAPPGAAALGTRHSIKTQTTEPQIHALARLTRVSLEQTHLPPLFGHTCSFLITASNWSKARLFEVVDFGPAVQIPRYTSKYQGSTLDINRKSIGGNTGSGCQAVKSNPVSYHVDNVSPNNMLARNAFFFAGTPRGDYWVNGCFPIAVWKAIEGAIRDNLLASL